MTARAKPGPRRATPKPIPSRAAGETPLEVPKTPNYRLNIEYLGITVPTIHPDNTRKHNKRNMEAIKKSLITNGQTKPIVLSGLPNCDYVLAGNGALQAARELGWTEIACVRVEGLTEEQELAYIIADNQTTDLSEFEWTKLTEVFRRIEGSGVNLDTTGFEEWQRRPLLEAAWHPGDGSFDPNKVPKKRTLIEFSDKQWARIKGAVEKAKEEYPTLERAPDNACLTYVAEMYCNRPFNPPYVDDEEDTKK